MTVETHKASRGELEAFRKIQFGVVLIGALIVPAVIVGFTTLAAGAEVEHAHERVIAGAQFALGFGAATLATLATLSFTVSQRRSAWSCLILSLGYIAVAVGLFNGIG
ncbi:hypothetical protein ACI3KX_09845 [Microbacterium sp. ZW CA_36]|uniref:hypothetical protein n=1 Tax=Microbacterium sp. ZW CA_36 TaxID=3378078 RepID=UPI0038550D19